MLDDEYTTTLVIATLKSIMQEQVDRLNSLGLKAVYDSSGMEDETAVINGSFQFVFGNLELLVGKAK